MTTIVDVLVIGAGPAGSAAARECATKGLNTLLIEKASLPRDKACSGLVMGTKAQALVREKFGEIPPEVLCQPPCLKGHVFHVPNVGQQKLADPAPLTWRRNLDNWLAEKAVKAGAKLSPATKVITMRPDGDGYQVIIERPGEERDMVRAGFLIGADGGNSFTRESLFPALKPGYAHVYQECYQLAVSLEPGYLHWFYPLQFSPTFATAHVKDDTLVIDVSGGIGQLKELRSWFRAHLAAEYGFDPGATPVWQGGCLEPVLYRQLFDGSFLPARGNALLVGDAAGLLTPVSGAGIGPAVRSGLAAAGAIAKATKSGGSAAEPYLDSLKPTLADYKKLAPGFKKITAAAEAGGAGLPRALATAFRATLRPPGEK
ncbi:MAG: NAD(P)/FAD-dependent oxidoreductase [Dehalococcoidia bacterium]|nr:MAG: NAD(P)/FAD-dependent oxidoreductase [Dehalococcoidia bacterium]